MSASSRVLLLGLASWAVPFFGSFVFFDRNGQLTIPRTLFKSLMVVVFGGFDSWLLVKAFQNTTPTPHSGLAIGSIWFAINIALDVCFLMPMSGMPFKEYMFDIGLRYLLMPIIGWCMGSLVVKSTLDSRKSS
jgi:hypothetical protein